MYGNCAPRRELVSAAFLPDSVQRSLAFGSVGRKKRRYAVLAHRERNEALFRKIVFQHFRNQHFGRNLLHQIAIRFVQVNRQLFDGAAALWTDDVRTPPVLGKALCVALQTQTPCCPQEVIVTAALFGVAKRLDRIVDSIRTTQQKRGQVRPMSAGIFGITQAPPRNVLFAFELAADIFEPGQSFVAADAKSADRQRR